MIYLLIEPLWLNIYSLIIIYRHPQIDHIDTAHFKAYADKSFSISQLTNSEPIYCGFDYYLCFRAASDTPH